MEQLPLVGYMPAPSGAATPDRTHTSVMPLSTSAKRTLLTRRILPQPLAQTNRFRRSRSVGGLRLRLVRDWLKHRKGFKNRRPTMETLIKFQPAQDSVPSDL